MKFYPQVCTAVLSAVVVSSATAADFSFDGTLSSFTDEVHIDFTVSTPGNVVLETISAGDGSVNFNTMLSLFRPSGDFLAFSDDIDFDNDVLDAKVVQTLSDSGAYRVVLTSFPNFPAGTTLAEGFTVFDSAGAPPGPGISLSWNLKLTGDLAEVSDPVVVSVPVPEPSTYALLASGLGLVAWAARRRKIT